MDIKEINSLVAAIEAAQANPDTAHCLEDELHIKFIQYVLADGPPHLAIMAWKVLTTSEIDFPRWTA